MRLASIVLTAATLLTLAACHPASTQTPVGTSNGTTPTSDSGGAPGTTTSSAGIATPNGTPAPSLPTDPNAASASQGGASATPPDAASSTAQ